jgi:hypothetical protein
MIDCPVERVWHEAASLGHTKPRRPHPTIPTGFRRVHHIDCFSSCHHQSGECSPLSTTDGPAGRAAASGPVSESNVSGAGLAACVAGEDEPMCDYAGAEGAEAAWAEASAGATEGASALRAATAAAADAEMEVEESLPTLKMAVTVLSAAQEQATAENAAMMAATHEVFAVALKPAAEAAEASVAAAPAAMSAMGSTEASVPSVSVLSPASSPSSVASEASVAAAPAAIAVSDEATASAPAISVRSPACSPSSVASGAWIRQLPPG